MKVLDLKIQTLLDINPTYKKETVWTQYSRSIPCPKDEKTKRYKKKQKKTQAGGLEEKKL